MAGWQASPRLPNATRLSRKEALDPLNPIRWKQHAVIRAEQAALVHGDQVDPFTARLIAIFNLGRADADIVVMVRAPQRVHAVGRSGTPWVAFAVARRSAASSAIGPPSIWASLPIFTYQRGHRCRRTWRGGLPWPPRSFPAWPAAQRMTDRRPRIGRLLQAVQIIIRDLDGGLVHQDLQRWPVSGRSGSLRSLQQVSGSPQAICFAGPDDGELNGLAVTSVRLCSARR